MTSLFRTRRLLLFAAMALVLPLLAACAGGDDDDDEDPTATTESAVEATTPDTDTVETPEADPTTDVDAAGTPEDDMTGTPDVDATPDTDTAETPEADMTPDAATTGTPEEDSTPETDGTPDTATTGTPDTEDADGTPGPGGMVDDPFADVGDLQADIPNFTLDFSASFENVPDDTGQTFSSDIEMMLMQSEPDVYHLSFMTTGDEAIEIEVWSLEDATYIAESGEAPVELPGGFASEFAPSNMLVIVPPVETLAAAEEVGSDEVDGRDATQYRVDAEAAAMILATQGTEINDPEGEMMIWLDDETDIVLQMTADVTWTNQDDSEASVVLDYAVSDVDETDDIEAPTS